MFPGHLVGVEDLSADFDFLRVRFVPVIRHVVSPSLFPDFAVDLRGGQELEVFRITAFPIVAGVVDDFSFVRNPPVRNLPRDAVDEHAIPVLLNPAVAFFGRVQGPVPASAGIDGAFATEFFEFRIHGTFRGLFLSNGEYFRKTELPVGSESRHERVGPVS